MVNPLSAKFIKWSNTLKQIVGKLPTICLSMFDHFSGLAFKGLKPISNWTSRYLLPFTNLTQKQPSEVFYKKGVLKNFANSQQNTCARVSF